MIRLLLALLNLLGFPGIGTLLAGHKKTGIIQLLLGLAGFALTVLPLLPLLRAVMPYLPNPAVLNELLASGKLISPTELVESILLSFCGIFIFFCNWLWSSFTTKPRTKSPPPLPGF